MIGEAPERRVVEFAKVDNIGMHDLNVRDGLVDFKADCLTFPPTALPMR
jgi:hypothetical protein